jgi:hypothetical protein
MASPSIPSRIEPGRIPPAPSARSGAPRALRAASLAAGLALAAVAIGPVVPPVAAAEGDKVKRAREHYRLGEEAFKAGRYDEALMEFEAGFHLSQKPLFLLNMAHAERRRGDLRKARAQYKRYLLMEPDSKYRGEVEAILQEIDASLAASEPAAGKGAGATGPAAVAPPPPAPTAPPPATSPPIVYSPVTPAPSAPARPEEPPPVDTGTPTLGVAASPPPPPRDEPSGAKPLWQRWELWAGAGAVVVTGIVVTLLLSSSSYEKDGSLGTLGP